MVLKLKLLPRYIIVFGFLQGIKLFIKVEIAGSKRIKVRNVTHPFELRTNTSDKLVFREVFLFKSYDRDWPQPNVIIDGGGNIGLVSVFFASRFPKARIFSIEPSDSNFKLLQKNTKPYPFIVPVQSALWNKDEDLIIANKGDSHWAFTVEESKSNHGESFKAMTISSLMKEKNIDIIDILKLDVEGAERELFTDNYDYWITRTKYILIELHDWIKPDCSKKVFKTISSYNFQTIVFNGMLVFVNSEIK